MAADKKNKHKEEEQDEIVVIDKKHDVKRDMIIKTLIIIAIIDIVNIITTELFTRVDLTKNQSYTLSKVSEDVIYNLNDNLVIKAYVSENLPPPFNDLGRQIKDVLDDYRALSDGRMNYEYISVSLENDGDKEIVDE